MEIKFTQLEVELDTSSMTPEKAREEYNNLMTESRHWLAKIAKLNARYSGKINRINKKLEALAVYLGE